MKNLHNPVKEEIIRCKNLGRGIPSKMTHHCLQHLMRMKMHPSKTWCQLPEILVFKPVKTKSQGTLNNHVTH